LWTALRVKTGKPGTAGWADDATTVVT